MEHGFHELKRSITSKLRDNLTDYIIDEMILQLRQQKAVAYSLYEVGAETQSQPVDETERVISKERLSVIAAGSYRVSLVLLLLMGLLVSSSSSILSTCVGCQQKL